MTAAAVPANSSRELSKMKLATLDRVSVMLSQTVTPGDQIVDAECDGEEGSVLAAQIRPFPGMFVKGPRADVPPTRTLLVSRRPRGWRPDHPAACSGRSAAPFDLGSHQYTRTSSR